jgi:hypothetical protein
VEPPGLSQADIDAAVRRSLGRLGRRYAPVALGLLGLLLIVTLVPTVSSSGGTGSLAAGGYSSGRGAGVSAGSTLGGSGAPSGASGPGAGPGSGSPSGGATGAGSATFSGSGGGSTPVPAGITPSAAAGSAGVARSGVTCGPGVRQVTWTGYAPLCVPAYSGDNGGATSHGVTATTITAVYRRTNSLEEKAAFAAVSSAAPGSDDQYLFDLRTYVDYFNRAYELYGRKVQVVDYNGVGDNLQEDQGQDIQGAQADAATAAAKGAFVDVSSGPTLASTELYEEALANQHVIALGAVGLPSAWFTAHAPWEYSIAPDGSESAQAVVNGVCQRLNGLPAIFAGNKAYTLKNRVFGLITPDNPEYVALGDIISSGMKSCGASLANWSRYSIDVSTEEQQSLGIVGQMNASGVSTVLCVCDPVMEVFLGSNASGQEYDPEWLMTDWLDPLGRVVDQTQMSHAISAYWVSFPPLAQNEAYRVFKLADPSGQPEEKYYVEAYWTALYLFDVVQQAGPDLTPATFEQASFAMPKSPPGMFGVWQGRPGVFAPATQIQIDYWNGQQTSNFDGTKGGWEPCDGGQWYSLLSNDVGPPHTQLHCFGK